MNNNNNSYDARPVDRAVTALLGSHFCIDLLLDRNRPGVLRKVYICSTDRGAGWVGRVDWRSAVGTKKLMTREV